MDEPWKDASKRRDPWDPPADGARAADERREGRRNHHTDIPHAHRFTAAAFQVSVRDLENLSVKEDQRGKHEIGDLLGLVGSVLVRLRLWNPRGVNIFARMDPASRLLDGDGFDREKTIGNDMQKTVEQTHQDSATSFRFC